MIPRTVTHAYIFHTAECCCAFSVDISTEHIPFPRVPVRSPAAPPPWIALIAPLVVAAAMWAITGSSVVVVFAVLGPVIALATMGDSRRRLRRETLVQHAQFNAEILATNRAVDEAHGQERAELERIAPPASDLSSRTIRDSERWRSTMDDEIFVRLGLGRIASRLVLDDVPEGNQHTAEKLAKSRGSGEIDLSVSIELRESASILEDAPVVIDAHLGIGIFGAPVGSRALAASIIAQLANSLSPKDIQLTVFPETSEILPWTSLLPHRKLDDGLEVHVPARVVSTTHSVNYLFQSRRGGATIIIAIATVEEAIPRDCRVIVEVSGSTARVVRQPQHQSPQSIVPDFISDLEAQQCARLLRLAAASGVGRIDDHVPTMVSFHELLRREPESFNAAGVCTDSAVDQARNSLRVIVGECAAGPVSIDLVTEGPHAIIGGTTGSGKSEVLVSWVLALAAKYSAAQVNFLLVDFKGGATFAPIEKLPHITGVLTDLNEEAAHRAILSLRAEVRRREQLLADHAVRSIGELSELVELPRLVIVVDEFATLVSTLTDLHELFADLAARGRSLGIHLILCTQRPVGTIREIVLANCALRISLRVNNAADSVAVIGVPDAARLPRNVPGRGLLTRGGENVLAVQWALSVSDDAQHVFLRSDARPESIRRPWLDPLPEVLRPPLVTTAVDSAIEFGVADIPEEQRQEAAVWNPATQGNLMVVGGRHSGKSVMLSALARVSSEVVEIPSDIEGAWDEVTRVLEAIRSDAGPKLVMVDDVDVVAAKFGAEHETAFIEKLTAIAREGKQVGTALALTANTIRGRVQSLATLCEATLVLRMRDRQEHVLVGGDASWFSERLPPGAGYWRGHRVQVYLPEVDSPRRPESAPHPPVECSPDGVIAVVSSQQLALRDRLESLGEVTVLDERTRLNDVSEITVAHGASISFILGDPEAWQSSPLLLAALRSRAPVAFHDCSIVEFRSLTRRRELPLPVALPLASVVVVHPDGRMHRASIPT